jgi:ATP phosphoribosyltransferase regulatory subunit
MTTSLPIDIHAQADALVAAYARAGYALVSPAILQPAEPFLDLSGEDMRRHMYLVTDSRGSEFCLRPDLTIPVARHYLASPAAGAEAGGPRPAGFCYLGTVFRDQGEAGGAGGEFLQAGIESFGRPDTAADDAEALALGLAATAHFGLADPEILTGDVSLFAALIDALDLAPAWQRRLLKDYRKAALADLERLTLATHDGRDEYRGVLAALANANPKAAHALVTDLLSIAGIRAVGGRSIAEIADRFVEQAGLRASNALPPLSRSLIERFLAIAGAPGDAAAALRRLAGDARISLGAALALFENRNACLAGRGIDLRRIRFATAFGRAVDYYTGFVFELHDPARRAGGHLVAGGRYDTLMTRLGSAEPVPAVGFAAWIERLAALQGERMA